MAFELPAGSQPEGVGWVGLGAWRHFLCLRLASFCALRAFFAGLFAFGGFCECLPRQEGAQVGIPANGVDNAKAKAIAPIVLTAYAPWRRRLRRQIQQAEYLRGSMIRRLSTFFRRASIRRAATDTA